MRGIGPPAPEDEQSRGLAGMTNEHTARASLPPDRARSVRLQTLVRLRWLAVLGQLAAVLFVAFVLGFDLPFWPAVLVITLTAWLNIFLTLRWRTGTRLSETHAALLLAFDIVQLAALLFLTGGLQNPFAILFLAPVTIAATTLSSRRTLMLGGLALALITLLGFFHFPLPWWPGETFSLPRLYVLGVWGALVSGLVFTAFYAHRIACESREMAEALNATELALARQQQLYALDGLAAAAAHELGTPLATIALVAKEMRRECPEESIKAGRALCEDLDLIISQAERCREILARLADHRRAGDAMLARMKLTVMLEQLIDPLRGPDLEVRLEVRPGSGNDGRPLPEPVLPRNPGILYGLGNIIENACDFAESEVVITAEWDEDEIAVTIMDDGQGFSEDVMDRLGEPFVTTRGGYYGAGGGEGRDEEPSPGMGLGFFIAKTLLERTGAQLGLANRPAPEHGAIVRVAWPRRAIEIRDRDEAAPSSPSENERSQARES
jgi:two-component system sensor histidine kinase RegB